MDPIPPQSERVGCHVDEILAPHVRLSDGLAMVGGDQQCVSVAPEPFQVGPLVVVDVVI
jgi:hypothetical protein